MDLALLIHPTIAAGAVLLVVTSYVLKTRKRLYFNAHYISGILAFSASMVAFPLGLYYVYANGGVTVFPAEVMFHTLNFFVAVGLIFVQGGLGTAMLLFGRKREAYRTHKRLARYVLAVFVLQAVLGLATLYGVLPFISGP